MATQPLFSRSDLSEQGLTSDARPHTQREAFKQLRHALMKLTPAEFETISGIVETLHRLAYPPSTPSSPPDHAQTGQSNPLISIGPSGLGGRYQNEF